MASRRIAPPAYGDRFIQASEMMHFGRLPTEHHPMEPLPPPGLLEDKLAVQATELQQLASDNHKLASSHLALRQDLVAAQQEADKLREHIRSIQTEGDIQIRMLLNKIANFEADIRAGDKIKKELQEAHIEAQSLVTAKLELTAKIQQATKELDNSRADVKKLPEMHAELETLRQEHQTLRKTFEYEKGVNMEKVEQMKILEKDLIAIAEEVERLRAEVLNAEKRASAPVPYNGSYMNSDNLYPPAYNGTGGYPDSSGGPHFHAVGGAPMDGMNPYASGGFAVDPPPTNGPVVSATGGGGGGGGAQPAWGGVYDSSHIPR